MTRTLALSLLLLSLSAFAAEPPATTTPTPTTPATTTTTTTTTPASAKKTYDVDVKKSQIAIQVFKDGAAAALAHDHVVVATDFSGKIVVDAADLSTASLEVTAQTASFVNDDPKMRKKFGLEGELSDKDRAAVDENMKSKDQLDIGRFPTVKFASTSVTSTEGKLTLKGKLTLHGVTKDVSMPLDAKADGTTASGSTSFRVKTSDYNIPPYSALLGAVKNKDEIVVHIQLVATAH